MFNSNVLYSPSTETKKYIDLAAIRKLNNDTLALSVATIVPTRDAPPPPPTQIQTIKIERDTQRKIVDNQVNCLNNRPQVPPHSFLHVSPQNTNLKKLDSGVMCSGSIAQPSVPPNTYSYLYKNAGELNTEASNSGEINLVNCEDIITAKSTASANNVVYSSKLIKSNTVCGSGKNISGKPGKGDQKSENTIPVMRAPSIKPPVPPKPKPNINI